MNTLLALGLLALIVAAVTQGSGLAGRAIGAVVFLALAARICQGLIPQGLLALLPLVLVGAAFWGMLFGFGRRGPR